MGYDLIRFVSEVDEEFICPICNMVLENGVQSQHCEHTYCYECIKEFLSINRICPVDRNQLKLIDINPIPRALKNLLLKLEIKCDFESYGCQEVLKLDNIKIHSKVCVFNPNLKITCDRECLLEMTKTEYELHNCVTRLSDLVLTQQKQINKLENKWISHNGLIVNSNAIECYKANTSKDEHKNFFLGYQFAQNKYPLARSNPNVYIEIINFGYEHHLGIVLTTCYKDDPNGFERNDIEYFGYACQGDVFKRLKNNSETVLKRSTKWEKGDVITVGIEFHEPLDCELINKKSIYFKRNNESIYEEKININDIGLYPTFFS